MLEGFREWPPFLCRTRYQVEGGRRMPTSRLKLGYVLTITSGYNAFKKNKCPHDLIALFI